MQVCIMYVDISGTKSKPATLNNKILATILVANPYTVRPILGQLAF